VLTDLALSLTFNFQNIENVFKDANVCFFTSKSSKNKMSDDCYFYYYSSCAKGTACPFRHEPAAISQEVVCTFWKEGKCTKPHCIFRHMDLNGKKRNVIPCFYEKTPSGCQKPHCPFLHESPKEPHPEVLTNLEDVRKPRQSIPPQQSNNERGQQESKPRSVPAKIIVNKYKLDELKDKAILPEIDYAEVINRSQSTAGVKRKLPIKARLGNPTNKVSVMDRLDWGQDSGGGGELVVDRHIVELASSGSSDSDSGDELNSEEEALRRNAIQTLDLRKRLKTNKPVAKREVAVSQETEQEQSHQVEAYDPEEYTEPLKSYAVPVNKSKKDKKKKKEKKLMKKVKEGTASKKDLKKLKKKLEKKMAEASSGVTSARATSAPPPPTPPSPADEELDRNFSDEPEEEGPSLADRVANRQAMAADKRPPSMAKDTMVSPKQGLGSKVSERRQAKEKRKIVIESDSEGDHECQPSDKKVASRVTRVTKTPSDKKSPSSDKKKSTSKKDKKDKSPTIDKKKSATKFAEAEGRENKRSDKSSSKSGTDSREETTVAVTVRQPSIKTDDVKSMIADVDSLLSKSDDLESLLSPSKTSSSLTSKTSSASKPAAANDSNNQSMRAVEELEALLK